MKKLFVLPLIVFGLNACGQSTSNLHSQKEHPIPLLKNASELTEEDWKNKLSYEQYHVLRMKGTETRGTGTYNHFFKKGVYLCSACGDTLFTSETKYDSGSGWPAFYDVYNPNKISEKSDNKYGWDRTEVLCKNCGGHLGHKFDDGPKPTGYRYCINSICLIHISTK